MVEEEFSVVLSLKEHWFWQSPMDKSSFVEVQESSGKVLANCCRKKKESEIGHTEEAKRKSFILFTPPVPQDSSGPRETFVTHSFSHKRKWEHLSKHLGSPVVWDGAKKGHFFPIPSRILRCAAQKSRRGWENSSHGSQRASEELALPNCFTESIRKPAHELWGCLTCELPLQLAMDTALSTLPLSPTPTPWPALCPCPGGQRVQPLADG